MYKAAKINKLPTVSNTDFLYDTNINVNLSNFEVQFSSQEKQYLTYYIIQSIRYSEIYKNILEGFVEIYEGQSVIAVLEKQGKISQVYPLHDQETLNTLKSIWVKQLWTFQPLGMVFLLFCLRLSTRPRSVKTRFTIEI